MLVFQEILHNADRCENIQKLAGMYDVVSNFENFIELRLSIGENYKLTTIEDINTENHTDKILYFLWERTIL